VRISTFIAVIALLTFQVFALDYPTFPVTPVAGVNYSEPPKSPRVGYPAHAAMKWNVEGSWSPSRAYLIQHLQSGQHAGKFSTAWLNSLTYQELYSLHDDDHDGRVSAARVAKPKAVARNYSVQSCPSGRCPR